MRSFKSWATSSKQLSAAALSTASDETPVKPKSKQTSPVLQPQMKNCSDCKKEFSFFLRAYACKECQSHICKPCAVVVAAVPGPGVKKNATVKICSLCKDVYSRARTRASTHIMLEQLRAAERDLIIEKRKEGGDAFFSSISTPSGGRVRSRTMAVSPPKLPSSMPPPIVPAKQLHSTGNPPARARASSAELLALSTLQPDTVPRKDGTLPLSQLLHRLTSISSKRHATGAKEEGFERTFLLYHPLFLPSKLLLDRLLAAFHAAPPAFAASDPDESTDVIDDANVIDSAAPSDCTPSKAPPPSLPASLPPLPGQESPGEATTDSAEVSTGLAAVTQSAAENRFEGMTSPRHTVVSTSLSMQQLLARRNHKLRQLRIIALVLAWMDESVDDFQPDLLASLQTLAASAAITADSDLSKQQQAAKTVVEAASADGKKEEKEKGGVPNDPLDSLSRRLKSQLRVLGAMVRAAPERQKKQRVKMNVSKAMSIFTNSEDLAQQFPDIGFASCLKFSPRALAHQMTLLDCYMLRAINLRELVSKQWTRPDAQERSPNVLEMIKQFNDRSLWVVNVVLNQTEARARVQAIQHLILVAEELRKVRNFHAVFSFVAGLAMTPVHRLRPTWDQLPSKIVAIYSNLEAVASSSNNYRVYRQALAALLQKMDVSLTTSDGEALCPIPHLGVVLKDLFQVDEIYGKGKKSSEAGSSGGRKGDDQLVNFQFYQKQWKCLGPLTKCATVAAVNRKQLSDDSRIEFVLQSNLASMSHSETDLLEVSYRHLVPPERAAFNLRWQMASREEKLKILAEQRATLATAMRPINVARSRRKEEEERLQAEEEESLDPIRTRLRRIEQNMAKEGLEIPVQVPTEVLVTIPDRATPPPPDPLDTASTAQAREPIEQPITIASSPSPDTSASPAPSPPSPPKTISVPLLAATPADQATATQHPAIESNPFDLDLDTDW